MPAITLSSSPQRVMARNLSGSSVSSETLMRLTPCAASSAAYFGSCEPLVVSVSSSRAPVVEMARQRAEQRHDPAPHQRLAAGQPQLAHALGDEGAAQPVELLERQQVGLRQERHVLRHAVDAAEIAAVGHRDAQIGDRAPERIDQRRTLPDRPARLRTRVSIKAVSVMPLLAFPAAQAFRLAGPSSYLGIVPENRQTVKRGPRRGS